MRRRILVPIDPTEPARTRSAIEQVVRICRHEPAAVRLLRVQPVVSGHVAMFFDPQELRELQQSAGAEELQFAQNLLAMSGVSCSSTVAIGRSAETIV
ncbi:MAG TPA: universal stress protein, partial [Variovorax sp.]|nr:universal stress protein [Variovorax sp.]